MPAPARAPASPRHQSPPATVAGHRTQWPEIQKGFAGDGTRLEGG
ncbi:hypothetical protein ERO13_A01G048650v2 [Gossypium hirsutum]|nr:hypothetical protein ERO13_A01G048650v2 [Gossypium hirsutum]